MGRIEFPYGRDGILRLVLPPGVAVQHCDAPRGQGIRDVFAAVNAALAKPLNHPPLDQATFPGDKIVVAMGDGVPQPACVLRAVLAALVNGGASPEDISLLTTSAHRAGFGDVHSLELAGVSREMNAAEQPRWGDTACPGGTARHLSSEEGEFSHLVHDPANRRHVALLARSSDQMPVLLHRALLDADVMISVGCLQADDAPGYQGASGDLCPTFSDEGTQRRFRALHLSEVAQQHAQRAHDKAHEVAWLLGACFTVRVVPGRGEEILHVLAGDIDEVAKQGRTLFEEAWRFPQPSTASLVITAVEGGPEQQSWDVLGRALATAAPLAEAGGAVAICCDFDAPPGAALQQLAGADDLPSALRAIRRSCAPDALFALQLVHALSDLHVYLLSRLDRATVEAWGAVPVTDADELTRLARSRASCLLLSGGQHVRLGAEVGKQKSEGQKSEVTKERSTSSEI